MELTCTAVQDHINLFKPNGISYFYELDQSISALRAVGGIFHLYFFNRLGPFSGDPDQLPHSAASARFAYGPQKELFPYTG